MSKSPPPFLVDAALDHGLTAAEVERQWSRLHGEPHNSRPHAPCTLGSGIRKWDGGELADWARRGAQLQSDRVLRFIPASGAATRMFKALLAGDADAIRLFHEQWDDFPFKALAESHGPCATAEEKLTTVLERLALQDQPKGALPFHRESHKVETAFEAQMVEWAAMFEAGPAPLHFTLPKAGFEGHLAQLKEVAEHHGISCTASVQNPATDTVALDEQGGPFRTEDGVPLFRPGGHGALLHNLQDLATAHPGALITIKNIDNVRPHDALPEVLPWRRALLGVADAVVEARNAALRALDAGDMKLAEGWLKTWPGRSAEQMPQGPVALREALDRPLMVAGMVRNEGEPGGGPFWLQDDEGVLRAQIVESSEMNRQDSAVRAVVASATHFNPVDLVCALTGPDNVPYDLSQFVDRKRDFLVTKSHGGHTLHGLEHPGLWNGGMGRWNTVFVEVDSATFAPVKTVFDLLRPAHRTA